MTHGLPKSSLPDCSEEIHKAILCCVIDCTELSGTNESNLLHKTFIISAKYHVGVIFSFPARGYNNID